jgi:hypothetical protein
MSSKWFCNPSTSFKRFIFFAILASCCLPELGRRAIAADAPDWMSALVNAVFPAHDQNADALLLYSEHNVTVQSESKVKPTVRKTYKILRPDGREYGYVGVPFHPALKITSMHGWCIPTKGKDYEVSL